MKNILLVCFFALGCQSSSTAKTPPDTGANDSYTSSSGEVYALHSYKYCPEINGDYWEGDPFNPNAPMGVDEFLWKAKTYINFGSTNSGTYILKDAKDSTPIDPNNNVLYRANGQESYDENYPSIQPGDGYIYYPRERRTSCYNGVPHFIAYEESGNAESDDALNNIMHHYRTTLKMYILPTGDVKEETTTVIDGVGTFTHVSRLLRKL